MSVRYSAALLMLVGTTAAAPLRTAPARVPGYAALARLTLETPVIVRATVARAERLGKTDAPDVAPGRAHLLVAASIDAALHAPAAIAAGVSYLVEVSLDARGKPPALKGTELLLFLRPTPVAGQYVLASPHAQLAAVAATEATVRAVLAEDAGGAVPVITGVGQAFHVPGTVAGEAESQFFLTTRSGKPVSLVVLSRPGEAQRVTLALGDVIDAAASEVKRDTLLWYRLACFLPRSLPGGVGADHLPELAADYGFVLTTLGPCDTRL